MSLRPLFAVTAVVLLSGCGGAVSNDNPGGAGGGEGGLGNLGVRGSAAGGAGAAISIPVAPAEPNPGNSVGGCCAGAATCNLDEKEVPSAGDCPPGSDCHAVTECCSTVWCFSILPPACTTPPPTCQPGELTFGYCPAGADCKQVLCPDGYLCHDASWGASGCGDRVMCGVYYGSLDGGAPLSNVGAPVSDAGLSCNPSLEYERRYLSTSPTQCAIDGLECPPHTNTFSNACGCGCQQSFACPPYCPGPTPNPECSHDGDNECPYTPEHPF